MSSDNQFNFIYSTNNIIYAYSNIITSLNNSINVLSQTSNNLSNIYTYLESNNNMNNNRNYRRRRRSDLDSNFLYLPHPYYNQDIENSYNHNPYNENSYNENSYNMNQENQENQENQGNQGNQEHEENQENQGNQENEETVRNIELFKIISDRNLNEIIDNNVDDLSYNDINNPINDSCPITQEDFSNNCSVCQIKFCKHNFKKDPLINWLKRNKTCPVCRHNILTNSNMVSYTINDNTSLVLTRRQFSRFLSREITNNFLGNSSSSLSFMINN